LYEVFLKEKVKSLTELSVKPESQMAGWLSGLLAEPLTTRQIAQFFE
jgi:hypothetical protein